VQVTDENDNKPEFLEKFYKVHYNYIHPTLY
jgi:hypothetical protein